MLVEAIDKPMCYRWPDGEVQLVPGQPVDLPESRALRLLQRAPGKVRMVTGNPVPAVRPGARITWTRGDGSVQTGTVDVLHVDDAGTHWAFVTIGESWAAINMKFANGSGA